MLTEQSHPRTTRQFAPESGQASCRVEALCLTLLSCAMLWQVASDGYRSLVTPNMAPWLVVAAVCLLFVALAVWRHRQTRATQRASRILAALIIPTMFIVAGQYHPELSNGFDPYGGGVPIAISRKGGDLPGKDEPRRTIRISNNDFGSWFYELSHHGERYQGWHVELVGYVDRFSPNQGERFTLARQLMTCCVLDMSPFGFNASAPSSLGVQDWTNHTWLRVKATVDAGSGNAVVLHVVSASRALEPKGFFYYT